MKITVTMELTQENLSKLRALLPDTEIPGQVSMFDSPSEKPVEPTKDDLERFREDYGISANAPTKKITLENFSFCFSGAFNAASFVKQIKAFVPEGQLLRVSVAVEVVEPEPSATEPATEESP